MNVLTTSASAPSRRTCGDADAPRGPQACTRTAPRGATASPAGGTRESSKRLGRYLRARRESLTPADVGLRVFGRRRVAGLRREEVAELAGISREYYLRLEQGRGQLPSAAVIGALATALRLDEVGAAHLRTLAMPGTRLATAPALEIVPSSVIQLLDAWKDVPAYVQNPLSDILVANSMAQALTPLFTPGTNLLRAAFLGDPAAALLGNRDEVLARGVAGLRVDAGPDVISGDGRLRALVAELTAASAEFRTLWERYDVSSAHRGRTVLVHPVVGPLELQYTWLTVPGAVGQSVVAHVAEPGSPAARALARLGGRTASR